MEKREFLKKLGLLTVGGVVGGSMSPVKASNSKSSLLAPKKVIGLQIYSVMRELNEDVPAGLKKIADIGYSNIELAGYRDGKMGKYNPEEYRKIAEDVGLKITGSHVNPPAREYSKSNFEEIADYWKATVENHVKFGVTTLVQPGMPSVKTIDEAKFVGEVFNKAGEIAKDAGIKWGYHNHNMEFNRVTEKEDEPAPANPWMRRGEVIYDLFLNNTDPKLVFFEMDVYWTVMGQSDPLEYFKKYAGRFPVLHIKDKAVLGQSGMMNFPNIFKAAYKNGLDEFFVELEGIQGMTQFEGVKGCFEYLNEAPFVK